jgi:hypothetical protein
MAARRVSLAFGSGRARRREGERGEEVGRSETANLLLMSLGALRSCWESESGRRSESNSDDGELGSFCRIESGIVLAGRRRGRARAGNGVQLRNSSPRRPPRLRPPQPPRRVHNISLYHSTTRAPPPQHRPDALRSAPAHPHPPHPPLSRPPSAGAKATMMRPAGAARLGARAALRAVLLEVRFFSASPLLRSRQLPGARRAHARARRLPFPPPPPRRPRSGAPSRPPAAPPLPPASPPPAPLPESQSPAP